MIDRIGRVVVLVRDYDEAIAWYAKLGFVSLVDQPLPDGRRFVHLGLPSQPGVGVWLMEPATSDGRERVGRQTGGEPLLVLYTDDLDATLAELRAAGVASIGEPQRDEASAYVHVHDLYGNRIVLVELHGDAG
jgi:catechol 2,3-dioxygenase-like lactoylglutathione lyase family enzyme